MKVDNYGDLLGKVLGKPCIVYIEFGSYQGDYIAVLNGGSNIELFKGSYGSCSGCDWLEDRKDWSTGEVSDSEARSYVETEHPFAEIPKDTLMSCTLEAFLEMLPANTRKDIWDFDGSKLLEDIKQAIS